MSCKESPVSTRVFKPLDGASEIKHFSMQSSKAMSVDVWVAFLRIFINIAEECGSIAAASDQAAATRWIKQVTEVSPNKKDS